MLRLVRNKLSKWGLRNNRAVATFKENETKSIDVPSNADVVIIGGGSAGCNALYQLGKRGINAVLLEKSKLISGTTWHTAGLLWHLRGICDIETELLKTSRLLYSSMIDPVEATEKFPLLDKNAFQAAIYSPADGTIDPAMLVNALTKSAEKNGCKPPEDFSFSLYELNWNVFNTHVEAMNRLIPSLASAGIRTTVCGPESFTPDHRPIMGEDPRCTGLYYSCGYNSAGMMFGGGCGEQIALWIINGRPDKHMFHQDIRRFIPEQRKNSIWVNERSHEAYAKNYNIVFSRDEHLSGRNLKIDPFHNFLVNEGAVMEERQGWERPGWFLPDNKTAPILPYDYGGYYDTPKNTNDTYADILKTECTFDFPPHESIIREEALACRNNVALFNMSYFGKHYLCGPDAKKAVDYIFTAQMDREINRTVYTCMLNKKGGVEGDCTVTGLESGSGGIVDPIFKGKAFYIVSGGMSSYHTWAHISKVIRDKGFHVSVHNVTEQIGILSVQGPNSRQVLQTLIDDDLSNRSFPFSTSKLVRIDGELVHVFRLSFVGELGFELHIPRSSCEKVYKVLMECGKKYDMKLAGFRALYSLSCEKGYHLWGSDLRIDDNPIEAALEIVCRKNGKYLGKASVEQCRKNGIKKRLVHLHTTDDIPLWGMESVYRNDQLVGYLRRAEQGYTFKRSIGQAFITAPNGQNVTKEFLETGTYQIAARRKKYPAKMYLESPFDPQNKRLLGVYTI